ncbi:MAG TPA: DivIVA domain-containing protein, partial [Frankiaceae bacterium]|nr:DivIVA domain-containing protein [Frankiaceae bacterium]
MPLTPQDVQNKVFSPTRFRTGYNEDEVDAFLDEVEAELTRLLDENADLRRQLDEARRSGGGGGSGGGGVPTQLVDENTQLRRQLDDARRQVQMAQSRAAQQERPAPAPSPSTGPTAVPTPQPAAARGPGRGEVDVEIEQRVARTLVLAQRTADEA